MADVANSKNVTVETERDGVIFRVTPFHPSYIRGQLMPMEEEIQKLPDDFAF